MLIKRLPNRQAFEQSDSLREPGQAALTDEAIHMRVPHGAASQQRSTEVTQSDASFFERALALKKQSGRMAP